MTYPLDATHFSPLSHLRAELAHSTVLTSGTLAPLEGFASELGTPFDVRLEAPHVVDMARQVWAGVLGAGPDHTQLNGVFRNASTEAYQDAVGAAVLGLIRLIPDGVLLFVPSYSLLERLTDRWQVRGWGWDCFLAYSCLHIT